MAQERYKIDGVDIWQPDRDLAWDFETTYTADTTRTIQGNMIATPLFSVESYAYAASHVPVAECAKLLKLILAREFELYAFSPYEGAWGTRRCYVGKGSLSVGSLEDNGEYISSVSFNMIPLAPLS